MSVARVDAALALISAALIASELLLMRLLALAWSGQFAGFTISVAMLGLAAAGIALHFARTRLHAAPARVMAWSALAFAIGAPFAFALSQQLPFAPFMLLVSWREAGLLALRVVLFALPFFAAGIAMGTPFAARLGSTHALYACTMTGSALGALPLALCFGFVHPAALQLPVATVALIAAALAGLRARWIVAAALVLGLLALAQPFRYSEYKPLERTLLLPETRLLEEIPSTDALLARVDSPRTRYLPGLSLDFVGPLPRSELLFADGDAMDVLFDPRAAEAAPGFLRATPEQFAWSLRGEPRALLLHPAAPDVLRAQLNKPRSLQVVDPSAARVRLLQAWIDDPALEFVVDEGRHFLAAQAGRVDLLQLTLLAGSAGQSLNAQELLTREGFDALWDRLAEDGLLAIAAWVENPPRNGTRLAAWVADGLRRNGIAEPDRHVLALRGWSTLAVVVGRAPFDESEAQSLRHFIEPLSFDAVYFPGIGPQDANRRNLIPDEPYYRAFADFLAAPRPDLIEQASWQLTVPDDDRPFFAHWFRLRALPMLVHEFGRELLPYVDIAYLLQWAALIVAMLLGALLLLPPMLASAAAPRAQVLLVFLALGVGYMAVELWAIHALRLFLSHDAHATALTLGVMLLGSGLGALVFVGRSWRAFLLVLPVALLLLLTLRPLLFEAGFALPLPLRMLLAALWLLGPALLMGLPFPLALSRIEDTAVPWALAMNGFGSVVGALAANLVALDLGLRALGLGALLAYAAAIALLLAHRPAHGSGASQAG